MLDLTLQITADGSRAKAELREVEQGIQRVDKAAEKSAKNNAQWWQKEEQSIQGVTEALKPHWKEVSKVEAGYAKLAPEVSKVEAQSAKLGSTSVTTTAALSGMRTEGTALTTGLGALTTAGGLSATMLTAIAGGAVLAASAIGALLAFVADASVEYFKHGEAMAGARKELDDLTDSWDRWKMAIGEAALGDQAPIIGTFRIMEAVLNDVALKFATNIALAREFAGWWWRFNGGPDASALGQPDPTKPDPRWDGRGGRRRDFGDFGSVDPDLTRWDNKAYADEQAAIERARLKAERDRLSAAKQAARDAEEAAKLAAKAYDLYLDMDWERALAEARWMDGLRKAAERSMFAEQGPSEWDYDAGDFTRTDSGRDPGIGGVVGRDWTEGSKRKPSYGDRLTGLLSQDLVGTLQGYLTARSSKGGAIGGAIGGDIGKSFMTEDFQNKLSDKFGGVGGGIIGAAIPFLGTLVGSLVGKLFGKVFGQTQGQKDLQAGNKAIDEMKKGLAAQYGSEAAAKNASNIFGGDLTAAWSSQNLAGAERFKQLQAELAAKQAAFNSSLGGTLSKIKDLGGSIPEALRPYLESLEDAKVLTQENIDLIASMAQDAVPTWEQMAAAAERLGISTDALGQSFQNAKAAANWQSVIDDLDTLIRGGADLNALIGDEGLQKKFNELVQQSIKFGTTIPENMKPWIQKLIETGKLIGEDGKAITDISKLSFGETMQTTLEKLNLTLKELIDTLSLKLPQAAKEGVDGWNREWDRAQRPDPTGPRREGTPDGDYSAPSASRRSGGGTAIFMLDNRVVAQGIVPFFPGAVKKYVGR